ncbi:NAD(P)H-dependent oxidoreductase [Candidatus Peregrinibacteria bacterium]|nr:MAG: NAD(P)H-dependent oxidoreductase [Candidatus Peregrinibacteria bacterium]
MSFFQNLEWRNATKHFSSEKVSEENLQKILHSIHLSPSSFGLQPYHVHVVKDDDTKAKILPHAWNQPQVTECSHILVFSGRTDIAPNRIDAFFEIMSGGKPEIREKMKDYEAMMRGFFTGKTEEDIRSWADRQTYIALGFAMAECAELQIDSCPMEGFVSAEVDKILGISSPLKSVVMLPIGYRAEDPTRPKVRFLEEELFTRV